MGGSAANYSGATAAAVDDVQVISLLAARADLLPFLADLQVVSFVTPSLASTGSTDSSRRAQFEPQTAQSGASATRTQLQLATSSEAASVTVLPQPLTIQSRLPSLFGSAIPTNVTYPALLYYSSTDCLSAGYFGVDPSTGLCRPCPEGGICPGLGRVYALPGYLSLIHI